MDTMLGEYIRPGSNIVVGAQNRLFEKAMETFKQI